MELKVRVNPEQKLPKWLLKRLDGDQLLAKILYQRGLNTKERLEDFLNPTDYQPTIPADFSTMELVRQRVLTAIKDKKKICIYGDYDVDGISSTTILYQSLSELGAEVEYYIPKRLKEGYGLNEKAVKALAQKGVDLLITCDCGISNRKEVALAKDLGLEVIITDHHQLPAKLPETDYILTPKFLEQDAKGYNLPGAGIAFMLAWSLLEQSGDFKELIRSLQAFLALAIVADVVPLYGDNRYFLIEGLKVLQLGDWPGIVALAEVSNLDLKELTAQEIAFQLAPRLNAVGRISTADLGVKMLLAKQGKAKSLAKKIDRINQQRKSLSEETTEQALELLEAERSDLSNLKEAIILYHPEWHPGIIGISAGRLKEEFHLPVILLTDKEAEAVITASARSIAGVHLYQSLEEIKDLLLGFGGHEKAAGFSLAKDKLEQFKLRANEVLNQALAKRGYDKEVIVDAKLNLEQVNLGLHNRLATLAPFGEANPMPKFLSTEVRLLHTRDLKDNQHFRLVVDDGTKKHTALWWYGNAELLEADSFDIIYAVKINDWQNNTQLQLEIKELLPLKKESSETKSLDVKLFDYRYWQESGKELTDLSEGFYFIEGEKHKLDFLTTENSGNRYQIKECKNLILLSCPADFNLFKELIYKSGAQNIILAYSDLELRAEKNIIKKFATVVKTVINNQSGKTTIEELATTLAIKEATALVLLRFLQEKGLISFEIFNFNQIQLIKDKEKGHNKKKASLKKKDDIKNKLNSLLMESRAYRKYMLKAEIKKIEKLLN